MTSLKCAFAAVLVTLCVACSSNSGPPDEARIKATVNQWLDGRGRNEQVQNIAPVYSTSETECETTITDTTNWRWRVTMRKAQDSKWYLAEMNNGSTSFAPNLEIK